jgi:hypothetical protein
MLWYKGWLETRGKMLLVLLIAFFPVVTHRNAAALSAGIGGWKGQIVIFSFFWTIVPLFLAGSGIKTQTLRAQRGLHGSMYYTLSGLHRSRGDHGPSSLYHTDSVPGVAKLCDKNDSV